MSEQRNDELTYRNKRYYLAGVHGTALFDPFTYRAPRIRRSDRSEAEQFAEELEELLKGPFIAPPRLNSTGTLRGFTCYYEVQDGFLCLSGLAVDPLRSPPDLPLRIPFAGTLLVADQLVSGQSYMGFQPAHRYEVVHELIFNNGRLEKERCRSAEMALFREEMANQRLGRLKSKQTMVMPSVVADRSFFRGWLVDCFCVLASMPKLCHDVDYATRLPEPLSVSVLAAALGNEETWEKCAAAELLRHLGSAAQDAVPALLAALNDPNYLFLRQCRQVCPRIRYVREMAVRALAAIAPTETANAAIPVMAELVREHASPPWTDEKASYVRFSPEEVRSFGSAATLAMLKAYANHPEHRIFAEDAQALVAAEERGR